MRNSIATSCSGLWRAWGGSGQTNGTRTSGCSITTMRPPSLLWLCSRFGLQNHDGHPPPLYSPDLALWDFLLFPQDEDQVEGAKIWHRREDIGWTEVGVKDATTKGLPGHRPIVAETVKVTVTIRALSVSTSFPLHFGTSWTAPHTAVRFTVVYRHLILFHINYGSSLYSVSLCSV